MNNSYDFKKIEEKWQQYWKNNATFKTDVWDFSKPKYYALDMFPYPSGVGLHAGHVEGYTATDVVSRMKRMQGFNVLHPMGWDAFGLPAEQFAIKTGNHPDGFTQENIATFKKQLNMLGLSYDWSKEFSTTDPSFYKWTQWIFKQLYLDGYAKQIDMPVNWCEELGTVLSNDEVIDGKSERGGFPVVRKNMKQWVIDIPKYAEKLLSGLDEVDWPESTKEIQRNWIGKSTGVEVDFNIVGGGKFCIYTTCIETIYGITFMVLAPENKLVDELKDRIQNFDEVKKYREIVARKSDLDRTELNKEKTGIKLEGIYAINPVNGREVPIYLGDFVLANYGTGAVMAVPAHDQRDYEFAKNYNIPIIQVIDGRSIDESALEKGEYLKDEFTLINSEEFNGLSTIIAKEEITKKLENLGCARRKTNYKLREWIFARQRYWGEPIPIIHLEDGRDIVLNDDELPLILPELEDYKGRNGQAPLLSATNWVNVEVDGIKGIRETSTMPGSAGSSWYFLRYIDPQNNDELANKKLLEHWMPVDLYVGGPEHAVGHLLYSRMWNKYLYDKGIAPTSEPFKKLVHQGMVLGSNGIKMGKRYPEYSVNPNDIVNEYGADTLRFYEMFMGPLDADKPWSTKGVEGAHRFLERVYRLYTSDKIKDEDNRNLEKVYHQTIKKVTNDFENLCFNTAISQMMIFINAVYKEEVFPKEYAQGFIKLLNPLAPHLCEELWQLLGNNDVIAYAKWPEYVEEKCIEDEVQIGVQVNGKLRATINVAIDESEDSLKEKALKEENVIKFTEGKEIVKIIAIKGKIVNIVVK